jgi:hypothetical protein
VRDAFRDCLSALSHQPQTAARFQIILGLTIMLFDQYISATIQYGIITLLGVDSVELMSFEEQLDLFSNDITFKEMYSSQIVRNRCVLAIVMIIF